MNNDRWLPVIHKKTGNIYFMVSRIVNCTNKANDCIMILYANTEGTLFCREEPEFWEKFETVANYEFVHKNV